MMQTLKAVTIWNVTNVTACKCADAASPAFIPTVAIYF